MTVDKYLPVGLKNPSLLEQEPATIASRIYLHYLAKLNSREKITNFGEFIETLGPELTYRDKNIIVSNLLIPKMFPKQIPAEIQGQKLIQYLKDNPNKSFGIKIKIPKMNNFGTKQCDYTRPIS